MLADSPGNKKTDDCVTGGRERVDDAFPIALHRERIALSFFVQFAQISGSIFVQYSVLYFSEKKDIIYS